MALCVKVTALLLCAGHAYASYFGGIGVGPFRDSSDSAYCPPGTLMEQTAAFCCPIGTQQDTLQDSNVLCYPSCESTQFTPWIVTPSPSTYDNANWLLASCRLHERSPQQRSSMRRPLYDAL